MAGTEYGRDWRIFFGDGGTTELFTALGGETGLDWKRASDKIDLSSKDDGIYKSSGFGQQELTISVTGNLKLPDTAFQAVQTASKASPPMIDVEIKKGAIVKYKGKCGVGNFSANFPQTGPATYSFDLTNIGTPDTDDLGASV